MGHIDNIIYYSGSSRKQIHLNTILQKILIRIFSVIRNIYFLKYLFHKSYYLPLDTIITSGFQCDSPNLHLENNVILGSHLYIIRAYAPVFIGKNTMLSHYNTIITSTHNKKQIYYYRKTCYNWGKCLDYFKRDYPSRN